MSSGIVSPSARMASMTLAMWTVFHRTMAAAPRVSYRFIARDLGLSKNTVMAIVQRDRAADGPHLYAA